MQLLKENIWIRYANINNLEWGNEWYYEDSYDSWGHCFIDKECYQNNRKWRKRTKRWVSEHVVKYIRWYFGNLLTGQGVMRDGEKLIRVGEETIRAGQDF